MGKIRKKEQGRQALRAGIYGGAFNPVHNGHINLAKRFIEIARLDKLFVVPTSVPPHKSGDSLVSGEDRLNMLSLAFEDNDKIEISDAEFKRQGKSYTYDTVMQFRKEYPNADFYLLVGQDQFLSFDKWYRFQDILKETTLCTAAREENSKELLFEFAENTLGISNCIIADFEPIVVSSSEIRDKIKNSESVQSLAPQKVLDYIENKELYRD